MKQNTDGYLREFTRNHLEFMKLFLALEVLNLTQKTLACLRVILN